MPNLVNHNIDGVKFWTRDNLAWPRGYLSWSQYQMWDGGSPSGRRQYLQKYIYPETWHEITNPAMRLGQTMATLLEHREVIAPDAQLEYLRLMLPSYGHREEDVDAIYAGVPLKAKPDGFDLNPYRLGEYKTGRSWTQERADLHEQIDFYLLVFKMNWPGTPETILHWIPTVRNQFGAVVPTVDIVNFVTERSELTLTIFGGKLVRAWREIGEACAAEYLSLGYL